MKRILCRRSNGKPSEGGQYVNTISNYLYRHIDTSYNQQNSANMSDVYFQVYYQMINDDGTLDENLQQMNINLNITTYQDKIRINVLELTPDEFTLGMKIFTYKKDMNLDKLLVDTLAYVDKRLNKCYSDREFVYR